MKAKSKGFFRYLTFGLRKEWMECFFQLELGVVNTANLGPVQKEALVFYLRDMELIEHREKTTLFYQRIRPLYQKKGINSLEFWTLLWINLCFNAPLFRWYSDLPQGKYSREEVISLLALSYGKRNRSITNAYTAFTATLEKTPIGNALKIGCVLKNGRQRIIVKEGGYTYNPLAVLYALYKYAERGMQYQLRLEDIADSPYSPQKILVLSSDAVKHSLLSLFEPDYLTVDGCDESLAFVLQPSKRSLDIIDVLIASL